MIPADADQVNTVHDRGTATPGSCSPERYHRLSRARLSGARLSGARLSGARLSGARLSGARLSGARFSRELSLAVRAATSLSIARTGSVASGQAGVWTFWG